ncbi:hypothetical protein BDV25DRAFT_138504 [Aspergillus avenaceus]|uniref:Uncharacterized protein n=1 Tax=Aspergillus avenaceus TaxID=36643 RepID=A0A5N6U0L3_ASPAV|nr:hypothetical protein BDV25DRAFT_138504 [Aspergillus avenaceus]
MRIGLFLTLSATATALPAWGPVRNGTAPGLNPSINAVGHSIKDTFLGKNNKDESYNQKTDESKTYAPNDDHSKTYAPTNSTDDRDYSTNDSFNEKDSNNQDKSNHPQVVESLLDSANVTINGPLTTAPLIDADGTLLSLPSFLPIAGTSS